MQQGLKRKTHQHDDRGQRPVRVAIGYQEVAEDEPDEWIEATIQHSPRSPPEPGRPHGGDQAGDPHRCIEIEREPGKGQRHRDRGRRPVVRAVLPSQQIATHGEHDLPEGFDDEGADCEVRKFGDGHHHHQIDRIPQPELRLSGPVATHPEVRPHSRPGT
ncbi:hypothetical protein SDC9_86201 [bioreactor metagenome]|uniref:Uncharacterized protein n=1 Tax=bioreactor metagenome TaxID=1076179 RepID=A0A644ZFS5_9ZZZZ